MADAGGGRRPPLHGWQYIIPAVGALASVVIAITAVLTFRSSGRTQASETARVVSETGTRAVSSVPPSTASSSPASTSSTVVPGALLGREVPPRTTESCHAPRTAAGSAWQFTDVELDGTARSPGYVCNLFSSGTGSLDFVLGKQFLDFSVSVGFALGSPSTSHTVRFEVIGDETVLLTKPVEVKFGTVVPVRANVTDVSRLRLRVTELSGGSSDAPSRPAFVMPVLRRAS